jgi:glyoxylase-like metal-dependent hydrolase (beta-lactamase superfamily II)
MCKVYTYTPDEFFGSNMFLIDCGNECAVVDPSIEFSSLKELLGLTDKKIKYVLVTHAHFDHILAIDSYVESGAEVVIGKDDAFGLSDSYLNCYSLFCGLDKGYYGSYIAVDESDTLTLGDQQISIFNTPGHTKGGVSYLIQDCLFVGDTVFSGGSHGRCDLPGGNFDALMSSISRIARLSKEIMIYCGHGASTTVKNVKNYFR